MLFNEEKSVNEEKKPNTDTIIPSVTAFTKQHDTVFKDTSATNLSHSRGQFASSTENKELSVDLTPRSDVTNKTCLRKIRRHYYELFKKMNSKLVRKRFWNVRNTYIFSGLKKMLQKIMPKEEITKSLQYYLIGIFKIKTLEKFKFEQDVSDEVSEFLSWDSSYSSNKFKKLFKSQNLRTLCKYVDFDLGDCVRKEIKKYY